MPHVRRLAPELIATAKAQRWDPAEVLKALFVEEVAGRDRSMLATRRDAAGFPTGKTFARLGRRQRRSIPAPTQQALRTLEWVHRRENLVVCGPSGTGKTFFLEALGQRAVETGPAGSPGSPSKTSASWSAATAPTTPSPKPSPGSCAPIWSSSMTSACCRSPTTPPKASTGSSTPPTRNARSRCRRTCTPPAFDELMPKTLATATVDRLLHHAHVCQTTGDSVRLYPSPHRERSDAPHLNPADGQTRHRWADHLAITGHFC